MTNQRKQATKRDKTKKNVFKPRERIIAIALVVTHRAEALVHVVAKRLKSLQRLVVGAVDERRVHATHRVRDVASGKEPTGSEFSHKIKRNKIAARKYEDGSEKKK